MVGYRDETWLAQNCVKKYQIKLKITMWVWDIIFLLYHDEMNQNITTLFTPKFIYKIHLNIIYAAT